MHRPAHHSLRRRLFLAATLAVPATLSFAKAPPSLDPLTRPAPAHPAPARAVMLAVARAGQRLVAVGEAGIILLSDDHGVQWRQVPSPCSVTLTQLSFPTARHGWAVGHGGVILHSADAGATWQRQFAADPAQADGPDRPLLDVHFFDDQRGLAAGAYGSLFATRDGGRSWQSAMDRLDNPRGRHLYRILATEDATWLAGEQGALFRGAADAGRIESHFEPVQTPYAGTWFDAVAVTGGGVLVLGLRGNAYVSPPGQYGRDAWRKVDTRRPVTLTTGLRLGDGSLLMADETGLLLRGSPDGRRFAPLPGAQGAAVTGMVQAADGALVLSGARGMSRIASLPRSPENQA